MPDSAKAGRPTGSILKEANRATLEYLAVGDRAQPGSSDRYEQEEARRLRFNLYMAIVAETIPRRLGREADNAALAADARTARRVANMYRSLLRAGGGEDVNWTTRAERHALARKADPGMRTMGATLLWPDWLAGAIETATGRQETVAKAAKVDGKLRWGIRRLNLLIAEIENLERIREEAT